MRLFQLTDRVGTWSSGATTESVYVQDRSAMECATARTARTKRIVTMVISEIHVLQGVRNSIRGEDNKFGGHWIRS